FYNSKHGAKWLPYYLDLKSSHGREIAISLQQTGYYRVLFFAREDPSRCAHVAVLSIAFAQQQKLQQWIILSNAFVSHADFQTSKNILKIEYEKLKPRILAKLQAIDTGSSLNLSC
nr:serine/threonine protein kinase [Aetokthonos hydrillicola CCALA 1050]